jgi:hypothetical protein
VTLKRTISGTIYPPARDGNSRNSATDCLSDRSDDT